MKNVKIDNITIEECTPEELAQTFKLLGLNNKEVIVKYEYNSPWNLPKTYYTPTITSRSITGSANI